MINRSELEGLIVLGLEELRKFEIELIEGLKGGSRDLREVRASVSVLKGKTGSLEALIHALEQADRNSFIAA